MSKQHTPGPWKAKETRDAGKRPVIEIVGASRSTDAVLQVAALLIAGPNASHDSDGGTGRADAALIVAAPELLVACEAAKLALRSGPSADKDYSRELELLSSAIAKAKESR